MLDSASFKLRRSGVLMHISSLPGDTGIGTLGKSAFDFIDFLNKAGQTYWQILPVCPTGFGDSPYQSFSTFAGNPYFIDLQLLCDEGWLNEADYKELEWGTEASKIDFGLLYKNRRKIFEKVQKNFEKKIPSDFYDFCSDNSFWLDDYSLFMAVKDAHKGASFITWEKAIRLRKPKALARWKKESAGRINYYKIQQYLFFRQWKSLKKYASEKGIKIIGDIPIYVSADSADVWTHPEIFLLNKNRIPKEVAGCPPDAFSEFGQLWGNPVYNWRSLKQSNYSWWKERLKASLNIYDVLRIDHFRGFDSFYSVKYGAKDAKKGKWKKGPGIEFFDNLHNEFGPLPIIAEDLGFLTQSVKDLLRQTGFPGMKILQFAFDTRDENSKDYFPERYIENCVVYTGTHDNDTINGWTKTARYDDVKTALKYFSLSDEAGLREKMMLTALNSKANICILTMQDLIGLGSEARMNTPSSVGENWLWRAREEQFASKTADWLKLVTKASGRCF